MDSAPHKAIIIIDPNCIFCHTLYQQVQTLIDAGQLQVRWLPVPFRDPSSPGKAAAILNAGSDAAADKLLQEYQLNRDDLIYPVFVVPYARIKSIMMLPSK